MNKVDIINTVMEAAGIEVKKQATTAVETVFDAIGKALARGEEVAVSGFGTFRAQKSAARQGVNPKTGEKIQIAASVRPKFKAAKALKDMVK